MVPLRAEPSLRYYSKFDKRFSMRTKEERRTSYFKNPTWGKNLQVRGTCEKCGLTTIIGLLSQHKLRCDGPRPCLRCGGERGRNPRFCSRSCANEAREKKPKKICENCKREMNREKNKFCSNFCSQEGRRKKHEALAVAGKKSNGQAARRVLIVEQCGRCDICQNHEWQNELIPLQLDHIDGHPENWDIKNLRLICPNCHAQTPTFGFKNKGNGRASRRARYARTGFC